MKSEMGRSLIEVVGVLAITGVMAVATVRIYSVVRTNQMRTIATTNLEQLVKDTKLLFETRGSYDGLSVDYLIKAGALTSNVPPVGDEGWSITPSYDGTSFSVNFVNVNHGDCAYFATAIPKWATAVLINGTENTDTGCFSSNTNQISFVVE